MLGETLRDDVQYVTVCQRPAGLGLMPTAPFFLLATRTVVLSAGGDGHVPLPLLARVLPRLLATDDVEAHDATLVPISNSTVHNATDAQLVAAVRIPAFGTAARSLAFYGSARDGVRARALDTLKRGVSDFISSKLPNNPSVWLPALVSSTLALAPRGSGVASFRFYEALQVGVPPVYVFDNRPWLPYAHTADRIGVGARAPPVGDASALPPRNANVTSIDWAALAEVVEVGTLATWAQGALTTIARGNGSRWRLMRAEAGRVRASHFTYDGVMRQIHRFFADPWDAELYCVAATEESARLSRR